MSDDLVTWLRAQLNEDERVARDAGRLGADGSRWAAVALAFVDDSEGHHVVRDEYMSAGVQAHIARHDPARVLAEVEAKRGLLLHISNELYDDPTTWERGSVPGEMLRLLAQPYADRPGYRDEWRVA